MSLTKKDLIAKIADETGLSRNWAECALNAISSAIAEQLKAGVEITLPGVGKFSTSQRAARTGRNPQTGEAVQIAASTAVKFSAAKALKDQVNT
ncbi:HU family DNA-binding protein [Achromobacter insolitus]|uniref:HU family DNA-binding protein n=1 Tax=Achromobacter insolitus TaxID=217204 RepID=UPI0028AEAD39|nr:HU family DNA-binding protein [Achromobacter insolitus]